MKKFCVLFSVAVILFFLPFSAKAQDFTAPEVPDSALEYYPDHSESFADGLWYVLRQAVAAASPEIARASSVCLSVFCAVLLLSVVQSSREQLQKVLNLSGTLVIAGALFSSAGALVRLSADTVRDMNQYGLLLLPVMTAALAAQGGVASSGALYTGAAAFDAALGSVISGLLVPMVYAFLALAAAEAAIGNDALKKIKEFISWFVSWCLKTLLYIFTGFLGVTGIVSGTTDAMAAKAARLAISGAVPVVGGILSDATESVLVSAGIVKNSVGIAGMLAITAIWIGPFLKIGIQYLLLKLTAAICAIFAAKQTSGLIQDFSDAMGLLLAMVGTMCLLLLISTVCFMKGVG